MDLRTDPPSVSSIFAPDGPLARTIAGFESRPEQVRMALAVERALAAPGHLLVEAGTGVGKSFAYLAPALRHAALTGKRVAVATSTIALQEQLVDQDLPALRRALPFDVSHALVKGRGNYVCRRRTELAVGRQVELFAADEGDARSQLLAIARWAAAGGASRQELPFDPSPDVWEAARAESGNCLHRRCPHYEACGYQASRRRTNAAGLLVMNHHVLLLDLAMRRSGATFLPDVGAIVVDEAHDLEDTAAECLGTRVSSRGVGQALGRLWNDRRGTGLLADHPDVALKDAVESVRRAARVAFDGLRQAAGGDDAQPREATDGPPLPETLADDLEALAKRVALAADSAGDADVGRELAARGRGLEALAAGVRDAALGSDDDHACWVEAGRGGGATVLRAPVDVGPLLRTALYEAFPTVVLTSATLSTGRPASFRYARERLGIVGGEELALGSPFDFPRQARIVVRTDLPDPSRAPDAYEAALPDAVLDAVRRTQGGAFVLFTSYASMRRVAERVRDALVGDGLEVLVQGESLPRTAMLARFREGGAVLFGVSSFWQGVDVPGDALRNVVIARIPFEVPSHPLQRARARRVEREGRSAFADLSLPSAALRLKQGFGRLVRRATDRGLVVLLDSRVVTKRYGRTLLESLPECPVDLEPGVPPD